MRNEAFRVYWSSSVGKALRRWLVSGATLSLIIFAICGCEKKEPARSGVKEKAFEVAVATMTPVETPVTVEYVAQTQSSRQVNIQARVNGFLEKRVYTEGAIVKEGETLFLMDQKPFKVQLDQAKASLTKQEAALEIARQNLARVGPLAKLNALSQKDLDDANGQFQSASAAVDQAKAQVEQAKLNLSYTVITSPVAGITSSAIQADGSYLNSMNSQLTTVSVISPIWVNFSVSENERQRFRDQIARGEIREPKDKNYIVEVILVDGSLFPQTGKITFAEPSFNPQTGTFLIRASLDNPNGALSPNQYVRVRLKGAVRPNAILAPQRAVRQGARGHFVWVVNKESKAELRPVVVGEWHGDDWLIREGLKANEQVVVDGGLSLYPGASVAAKPYVPGAADKTAGENAGADQPKADAAQQDK